MDREVYAKIKSILELNDEASALDVLEAIILLKQKKPLHQPGYRGADVHYNGNSPAARAIPEHLLRRAEAAREKAAESS